MEAQVRSADETQVRKALAVPSGQPLDPRVKAALASLPNLKIKEQQFRQVTATTAVVPATLPGPQGAREVTVPLKLVNGSWQVDMSKLPSR